MAPAAACNGLEAGPAAVGPTAALSCSDDKARLTVEVCLRPKPGADPEVRLPCDRGYATAHCEKVLTGLQAVKQAVLSFLSTATLTFREGPLQLPDQGHKLLQEHVLDLHLRDPQPTPDVQLGMQLCFWQVLTACQPAAHAYTRSVHTHF